MSLTTTLHLYCSICGHMMLVFLAHNFEDFLALTIVKKFNDFCECFEKLVTQIALFLIKFEMMTKKQKQSEKEVCGNPYKNALSFKCDVLNIKVS